MYKLQVKYYFETKKRKEKKLLISLVLKWPSSSNLWILTESFFLEDVILSFIYALFHIDDTTVYCFNVNHGAAHVHGISLIP